MSLLPWFLAWQTFKIHAIDFFLTFLLLQWSDFLINTCQARPLIFLTINSRGHTGWAQNNLSHRALGFTSEAIHNHLCQVQWKRAYLVLFFFKDDTRKEKNNLNMTTFRVKLQPLNQIMISLKSMNVLSFPRTTEKKTFSWIQKLNV